MTASSSTGTNPRRTARTTASTTSNEAPVASQAQIGGSGATTAAAGAGAGSSAAGGSTTATGLSALGAKLAQQLDLAVEVGRRVEVLVDAGETEVGDLVEAAQVVEHQQRRSGRSSPRRHARRTASSTVSAMRSTCSSGMARPLVAARRPLMTLARSNGSTPPWDLTTVSGTSSTRSNVVKRCSQCEHRRRRRTAEPSAARRESTTLVSSAWHSGQCTWPAYMSTPARCRAPRRRGRTPAPQRPGSGGQAGRAAIATVAACGELGDSGRRGRTPAAVTRSGRRPPHEGDRAAHPRNHEQGHRQRRRDRTAEEGVDHRRQPDTGEGDDGEGARGRAARRRRR